MAKSFQKKISTEHHIPMTKDEARKKIQSIVRKTGKLIPLTYEKDLPPTEKFPDIPEWHDYEQKIWMNGSQIEQILREHKSLRKDKSLLDSFLAIALNRNAKRGRQIFIMLLGYKHCAEYAPSLVEQIDDKFVNGHIIYVLNKMKVGQYVSLVIPYMADKTAWIRNEAKKYVNQYIASE